MGAEFFFSEVIRNSPSLSSGGTAAEVAQVLSEGASPNGPQAPRNGVRPVCEVPLRCLWSSGTSVCAVRFSAGLHAEIADL